jgi:hypothetical protein
VGFRDGPSHVSPTTPPFLAPEDSATAAAAAAAVLSLSRQRDKCTMQAG